MKLSVNVFLALPLVVSAVALEERAAKISYDGYKVFHINAQLDYDAVEEAISKLNAVSLSCEDKHDHFDVAVAPEDTAAFIALGLDFEVLNEDLGADIRLESNFKPYTATSKFSATAKGAKVLAADLPDLSWFDSYHVFEEHLQWLEDLQAAFPENSELFVAGYSLEGRPIQGIHLFGRDGPGVHEAIIWHGTVHAREWTVTPSVEYITYQLVDGYIKRACSSVRTLDNYDVYLMPVVNPDGFVHTHTVDRLWRKNRQARVNATCLGTDINRNWPYQWDVPGGSSTNPCSQTYRGLAPGDTPEMAVLTNHTMMLAQTTGIKLFIDWHAFSQYILLPYGYSCEVFAANNDYQMSLAAGVANAIKAVNGSEFIYGPACQTIYPASGGSMDWVYDVAGGELAWGIEVRPAAGTSNGFVLPPSQILPSGQELWAGMKWLLANM